MPLRLFYAIGPGDVVGSYRCWKAGDDVLSETARTYSSEFFDFCREHGHTGYAVSSFRNSERLTDESQTVENRPKRFVGPGIPYHLSQALYGVSVMFSAIRWRADAVIVDSGTTQWALLTLLKLFRIRVVACLHNVLWPAGHPPNRKASTILLRADAWFWRHGAYAVLALSPECERQVRELSGRADLPTVQYRAQYWPSDFAGIPAPHPVEEPPLRVMFAGRVERNKGVLDLVEIARLVESRYPGRVRFDVCGDGAALEELRQATTREGLQMAVRLHGQLNRRELLQVCAGSHVVIVPTRSDFTEGFAKVCAEAILCDRPVITSPVVPAAEVLAAATVMARTDDPQSYADAIAEIIESPELYSRLRSACAGLKGEFYDPGKGLAAALKRVFCIQEPTTTSRLTDIPPRP